MLWFGQLGWQNWLAQLPCCVLDRFGITPLKRPTHAVHDLVHARFAHQSQVHFLFSGLGKFTNHRDFALLSDFGKFPFILVSLHLIHIWASLRLQSHFDCQNIKFLFFIKVFQETVFPIVINYLFGSEKITTL